MKLKTITYVLLFLLSCFGPGQTQTAVVQGESERNQTEGPARENLHRDPVIVRLKGGCSWTLSLSSNSSTDDGVPLTLDYVEDLAQHVCQDLDCGDLHHLTTTPPAVSASCFHRCVVHGQRLHNCSQIQTSNCSRITEAVCGQQAVRLRGGPDRCAGRVELWRGGQWGTVCDDRWDLRDADVVCEQLDCGYALQATGQGGPFPAGRGGAVLLDDLNCTGRERNLWECPSAEGEEPDCGHKEDAGVICSEMRTLRLSGGLDRCAGKLEVHRNGSWGTVCDNCWNRDTASMVCSMLGCGTPPQNYSQFQPPLRHNNGTLYYYQCGTAQSDLWTCREFVNRPHLCVGHKASGVICKGSLGFIKASTESPQDVTVWTTALTPTVTSDHSFLGGSPELLGSLTVSLLLLVLLTINTVLCCHYRRRSVLLLQKSQTQPGLHRNKYEEMVDVIKVTNTNAKETTGFPVPSVISQNALQVRASKVSEDSFESSSSCSGDRYQNVSSRSYVVVTPDTQQGQNPPPPPVDGSCKPLRLTLRPQHDSDSSFTSSDEEDPDYSPVSPE